MSDRLLDVGRVRKLALQISKDKRNGKFKRVGGDFYNRIEARLKTIVHAEVAAQPAGGQTVYGSEIKPVKDALDRPVEVGDVLFDVVRLRELALHASCSRKHGSFSRVSAEFYAAINARLHAVIEGEIHRHPSIGQTLQ